MSHRLLTLSALRNRLAQHPAGKTALSLLKVVATAALPLLLLWLAGCSSEPAPRDTHAPVSDNGEISSFFYSLLLYLDAAILAIVVAVWAYALVKFKKQAGDDTLPEQSHGNMKLEVIWTAIPTLIVVAITVPMLVGVFQMSKRHDPNQPVVEVDVTGKQWWWEFDYKSGTASGLHTANELHLPAGTAVTLHMTSADVIHAWWVPRLGGKRDANPGRNYPMSFTAKTPGIYDGQCAELCGSSHALMGTKLIVHPLAGEIEVDYKGQKIKLESYESWVREQQAPAKPPVAELEKGLRLFKERTCPSCHLIQGLEGTDIAARSATSGPNLTHVGSRMGIAANTLVNNPENIAKWISKPSAVKPGSKMPDGLVTPEDAKAIAAFLSSLK